MKFRKLLILGLLLLCQCGMAQDETIVQGLLTFPVLLQVGDSFFGSGFYLGASNKLYLVTARHVLYNVESGQNPPPLRADNLICTFWQNMTNAGPNIMLLNLSQAATNNGVRFSWNHDIAVVLISTNFHTGPVNNPNCSWISWQTNTYSTGVGMATPDLAMRFDDITIGRDVFLFGFPRSLETQGQLDPLYPLVRKGIVAGKNVHSKTIILDCPVYEGNSGGPVLLKTVSTKPFGTQITYDVIGIATQFVPFVERWKNEELNYYNATVSNSGYSVIEPMDGIYDMLW